MTADNIKSAAIPQTELNYLQVIARNPMKSEDEAIPKSHLLNFELTNHFDKEPNILNASPCVEPQNSASALKSTHTCGLAGSV
jgi:hypothetical protein